MPLLDYADHPEAVDPALTEATGIIEDCAALHRHIRSSITSIFDRLWSNTKATPEEILAVVGTRATALFVLSAQLQALLNQARPDSINLTPPVEIEFNGDGSVTIKPAEPAE